MNTKISDAAKFTKRPVTIEAMRFDGSIASASAICQWANAGDDVAGHDDPTVSYMTRDGDDSAHDMIVWTLEDAMRASPGDWIIKGVKGEFYPCKPDIFELTYTPHLAADAVPVAWMIDWPGEPDLGHYFAEEPDDNARSRPLYIHPQPAALNEVSGNSGELGGDAPGITDKWVLEYLDTDAPESSREAIRNAFAEWNSLADNGALRGGRITGWAMVDGVRVFSASSHSGILDDQQFVRYDDHLAALAATGKQQVGEVQGSREQFEEWGASIPLNLARYVDMGDVFCDERTKTAWAAWQAAIASRQPGLK